MSCCDLLKPYQVSQPILGGGRSGGGGGFTFWVTATSYVFHFSTLTDQPIKVAFNSFIRLSAE